MDSVHDECAGVEPITGLCRFRDGFYSCLGARADAQFELTEALLCADGPVRSLVDRSVARGASTRGTALWVPETLRTSCDVLIFVEEAADAVVSLDLADLGRRAVGEWPCGSSLPQAAVRTVIVVVALRTRAARLRRAVG